jgi:lipopolysaccharide export system protein LptA
MKRPYVMMRCFQMNKQTLLIALLFIAGFQAGSVDAATTTTTVEVNVVSTINLEAQNGIVFGDISASSIPGTVAVDTDSSRTTSGGVTVNTATAASPAHYQVSGDPNAYYTVTLPGSVVLTSAAGDSMVVDEFKSIPSANGQLDSSGRQDMYIGARLNVGSFQAFGAYHGVMSATVDYD